MNICAMSNSHIPAYVQNKEPDLKVLTFFACSQFGLVKKIDSMAEPVFSKETVLHEYKDVFEGLGYMPQEHRIEIQPVTAVVVHPPGRVPFSLHGKLKETLDRLEKNGVIARVDRPTDWVNSLVIAEKKDGNLRLCLDPRDLNKVINCEHYKIPTAEEIASKLAGKSVFSILDEKDEFWQIPLDEESSFLCTFNSSFGRYRFLRCPFVIRSAPEGFQKRNDQLFGDIEGVHVVFDDAEHDSILTLVLDRARARNVKFKPAKFQFRVPEVK